MSKIKNFIKTFKKIKTSKDAISLNLIFHRNLHGDEINHLNCRSIWKDEYNLFYNCEEYYDGGIKLRKIKIEKILKNKITN